MSRPSVSRNGTSVLLLRAFLGVTFTVAGLQKLANPGFLRSAAPGSFVEQVRGSIATSPLHHLLDPALHAPVLVALVIACGELAVGIGTLTGLWSRAAAAGGMVLSLVFFLTVSFNDSPYYYGADIVFLFAWSPLLLGGAGPLSIDAVLKQRANVLADQAEVARARSSTQGQRRAGELERRILLERVASAGGVAAAAALAGGLAASIGRLVGSASTSRLASPPIPSTSSAGAGPPGSTAGTGPAARSRGEPTTSAPAAPPTGSSAALHAAPPGATKVLAAAQVPVGGAASFTDPAQQIPAWAVQPSKGVYKAFSAICTHAGCTVEFDGQSDQFVCPCHGSIFDASTGSVLQGPAVAPLPAIGISLGPGGALYADA